MLQSIKKWNYEYMLPFQKIASTHHPHIILYLMDFL